MITGLLAEFHAQANQPQEFVADDLARFMWFMVLNHDAIVLVSDGGVICGFVAKSPVNASWKIAMELYWYARDGSGARLMKAFENAAKDMGADEVRVSHMAATPRVGAHLKRRGYTPDEHGYSRKTSCV